MTKRAFTILTSVFLFFVLFFAGTLTAKEAQAACTVNPSWTFDGNTDGVRSVTYHLTLSDNCAGSNNYIIRVSHLPNVSTTASDSVPNPSIQDRLHADWIVKQDDGTWGPLNTAVTRSVGSSESIDIRVIRDINYYHPNGIYFKVTFRAELASNSNVRDTYSTDYRVFNRPDLIVSDFVYPSGPTCETANPTVKIKNIGWVTITKDFVVNVNNGNGTSVNKTITQAVDHNEEINMSARFSGMAYPAPGNYTARATVDSANVVTEEDENNSKNYNYTTTSCVIPITYKISGGIYEDLDESRTKNGSETYRSGNLRITNAATGAVVDSPVSVAGVGFTSISLPEGIYNVSYINPPLGYTVTFPTNGSIPPTLRVTIGPVCVSAGGGSSCSSGNIINLNFGIIAGGIGDAWIQGVGGDMRADNGMDNTIPDSEYFSRNSSLPFMDPGVVFGSGLNLGSPNTASKVSVKRWFVEDVKYSFPVIKTAYNEVRLVLFKSGALASAQPIFDSACTAASSAPNCTLDSNLTNGIYTADSDVNLNSSSTYTFPSGKNYIFLIDGNLKIENNIIIPKGSTAIFIVKGDITVAGNVTRIDGIYSANNDFVVEGLTPGADTQLVIGGSVIANAGLNPSPGTFINKRDLANNELTPAVKINYRPDFVLHAPAVIRYQNYTIKEVAPGSR